VANAHLFGGEQPPGSQPAIATLQIEGLADMGNLLQVERLILPSPPSVSIENFCDLAITVILEQRVDFGNHLWLGLSNLRDRQGLFESKTSRSAAAQAHMDLDPFSVDQRDILDQQTQNTFSLAGFDARIIPDTWEVRRQGEQLLASLSVNQQTLLLRLLIVLFPGLGQDTQLIIPLCFQAIGNQTIIGIDLHIAPASEFSLVLCSLNVLVPQRLGFANPCLNFLLNGESDL